MRFMYVTNKNMEDIFQVTAKYEQWEYVKHHIFDMVNNYVAIINEEYLPIPLLVYEDDALIGFVQINCYDNKQLFEICKIIVHETEQNKGYGKKILSNVIKWIVIKYGKGTIKASYKKANIVANKLFSDAEFDKLTTGDEIVARMKRVVEEEEIVLSDSLDSQFEDVLYSDVHEFAKRIKIAGKYPEAIIGTKDEINFRRINTDYCKEIVEMELDESQEEFIMPFVDSLAESYSDLFEDEITVTYVLCKGEKAIGLVEIEYMKGESFPELKDEIVYELFRIAVDKRYQNQGYGTKAIQLFLNYVYTKPLGDADKIVVSVVEGNDIALKLYKKFGFKIIGRDKYRHIAMCKSMSLE